MANIILVTSGKGGTGKTTVSQLVSRSICVFDKNVLVVEMDSGLRGLDLMFGVSDRIVYDLSDLLRGRCRPTQAIVSIETSKGNLHYIAAPFDRHFVFNQANLAQLLSGFAVCYDYIILDAAAGLGKGFDVAASVSKTALIVTTCDIVAVRDAAFASSNLSHLSSRLVINRFSSRQLSGDIPHLDTVIDRIGAQLIAVIPEDPAVPVACANGQPLSAGSLAYQAVSDLVARLMGESVLLNLKQLK